MKNPVKIFSEFQPLEEMILGRTYGPEAYQPLHDTELRDQLQKIAIETEDDISDIQKILESQGVTVRRPKVLFDLYTKDNEQTVTKLTDVGLWKTGYPNPPLWPRDLSVVYDDKILSTYSRTPNRWFEGEHFYDIFMEYFNQGADWRSMPPPLLDTNAKSYTDYEGKSLLYHAACFVKCGRDIIHTLPASAMDGAKGTSAGLEWVKKQIGPGYRFHPIKRTGHIDGRIALIKPGLLISWISRSALPECFANWDIIFLETKGTLPKDFEAMRGKRYYKDYVSRYLSEWIGCVDETYFDVNIISINENLVLLNGHNKDLEAQLNKYGVQCIPTNFRHRYFWDGGLHCISLDIRRGGECEDYFK